ncbi:hypothetical protein PB2503_05132 [Parvularcula bermudensis HTCC2503]|uniref:Histidine-specific methyltransferase SAM-dependent domain-containing protein n=1 Tax=Parvularcula bermudensis (strain ATCC BAA-594 / HTCC2503 / KCTC 12087) TaxID=314260 RepID=E0TFT6_PARBH|nr:L-histidine N(alpha)-methyltransferase [Parvularcula bermudensis]ADM09101.1 hypothetical protein PB2503_05132 [Parvularcula bermudensis HTCC2503]
MTSAFLKEVQEGLSRPQKALNPKWLYDHRGSELFEDITEVDEYYPTRTEARIFEDVFPELKARRPDIAAIVEYGSGSSKKTDKLLEAVSATQCVPIDISEEFLRDAANTLAERHPHVEILPVAGDFTQPLVLPSRLAQGHQRLGFFPGSTIGNFEPDGAVSFLSSAQQSLGEGSAFLVSADLIKDEAILEAAYDDASGVTAAFNLNLLERMNRELGANFDLSAFTHRSHWNETARRVEMHLVSLRDQTVTIGTDDYPFAEGEYIHTESSYKFDVDRFETLARKSGWALDKFWTDKDDYFGVFLLTA